MDRMNGRYLIVVTLDRRASRFLQRLRYGSDSSTKQCATFPELFALDVDVTSSTSAGSFYILHNNLKSQAIVSYLYQKYPNRFFVWTSNRFSQRQLPEKVVEISKEFESYGKSKALSKLEVYEPHTA